jgi:DNA-binding response OmpR family regulator
LIINKSQICSRENLAERIWGYESDAEYNNVEVYITFVRRKLKLIDSNVAIKAIRGVGYKLEGEKNNKKMQREN